MIELMDWVRQYLFAPDMFSNDQVTGALQAGGVVAAVSAVLGYFVVLRGLSFIGHAVTDIGFTGGAGASLLGLNALWGLATFCVAAALGVGALGERARERDVVTGVILALALGVGAMFLYINTRFVSAPFTLLFGSIFEVDPDTTRIMVVIGVICLAVIAGLYRPLLFSSLAPEAAEARGVPVRVISALFLACMAVAVAEAAQVVGVLLSTALLIGPAATAAYLVARPGFGIVLAAAIGVLETWMGIDLSYVSYNWPPGGRGWPVSFFITSLALLGYIVARLLRPAFRRPLSAAQSPTRRA
ncbi:MAG TPA: metal ABC transporter permease [Chloroflexota bacterium]|nr:metal ABC transporter permease [Chloroflexota bacterium]